MENTIKTRYEQRDWKQIMLSVTSIRTGRYSLRAAGQRKSISRRANGKACGARNKRIFLFCVQLDCTYILCM